MKFAPSRIAIRRPRKKLVIIIAAILVVLGLATYGVFSYLHWQQYDKDSQNAATDLKTSIDASFDTEKPPTNMTGSIDTIVKNFEEKYGSSPCNVAVWYNWQAVLPQLKEMRSKCDDRFTTALKVISDVKPLSQFIKDEKKAADLLAATLEASKTPTDYTATSALWKEAADSKELSDASNFTVIRTEITEVATAISTAYTALASAVSKEDKAAFDAAITGLDTAYALLNELKMTVVIEQTKLIKTFISSYEKL